MEDGHNKKVGVKFVCKIAWREILVKNNVFEITKSHKIIRNLKFKILLFKPKLTAMVQKKVVAIFR